MYINRPPSPTTIEFDNKFDTSDFWPDTPTPPQSDAKKDVPTMAAPTRSKSCMGPTASDCAETFGDFTAANSLTTQRVAAKYNSLDRLRDHARAYAGELMETKNLPRSSSARSVESMTSAGTNNKLSSSRNPNHVRRSKTVNSVEAAKEQQQQGKPRRRRNSSRALPVPSSMRRSPSEPDTRNRRRSRSAHRRAQESRAQARMNQSLSSLLDSSLMDVTQQYEVEEISVADLSKGVASQESVPASLDSKHSSKASLESKTPDAKPEDFSDSFHTVDSHPSLIGGPPGTWTCHCGCTMKNKMKFCGLCGSSKTWRCTKCHCDENIAIYVFCGNCGIKR